MSSDALAIARRNLNQVLDEKATIYFAYMKQWFLMKLTKEEFDRAARKLLTRTQVRYHNEFLLKFLTRIEGLALNSLAAAAQEKTLQNKVVRGQNRSLRASDNSSFDPVDLIDYLPPNSPPGAGSDGVQYATQEACVPDNAMVLGRFMVTAWEAGLEGVDDEAADVAVVAVQTFLKNVISAVVAQRKGYKTRNGRFKYDLGAPAANVWLRNAGKQFDPQARGRVAAEPTARGLAPACPPTLDEVEHSAAFEIACSGRAASCEPLSLLECYQALQTDRNVIASHSVYALSMERMANALDHPAH